MVSSRERGLTVERKLQAGFLAAIILLIVAGFFTWRAGTELAQSNAAAPSRMPMLAWLVLTLAIATASLAALLRGILRDKAARAKSEHALLEANRLLEAVVENVPLMIFVKDAGNLEFVRLNRAGEALLGLRRGEVLGKTDLDLFPAEIANTLTTEDREVLASGTVHDARETLRSQSGDERILHTRKIPIRDEAGQARYVLGIAEDVTEQARRDAEIRALNDALAQRAAEVEAVSKELQGFAYSVSHDLRAPLRHIAGYVQLLSAATEMQLEAEPRRYLTVIADASRHMAQLLDDLLAFSRLSRADMKQRRVDLAATVQSAIAGLGMAVRERGIEWRIHDLPQVEGDQAMLTLVLTHLVENAVKYTAPRSPAVIEIASAGEEGGRSILYVRDNGVGFDMKYADKLFGVFQRLHHADEFEGTGIGLAIVQRIIARHGGRVWAQGVPGEGATFYLTLKPCAAHPVTAES